LTETGTALAPESGKARLTLDMLRGFAILGIFFIKLPGGGDVQAVLQSRGDRLNAGRPDLVVDRAGERVFASLYLRAFANGPLEWAWRSLVYMKWQPFRKAPPASAALAS
jgi:uncharacterized membrane protein YeiB